MRDDFENFVSGVVDYHVYRAVLTRRSFSAMPDYLTRHDYKQKDIGMCIAIDSLVIRNNQHVDALNHVSTPLNNCDDSLNVFSTTVA